MIDMQKRPVSGRRFLLAGLAVILGAATTMADRPYWPRFHGPDGTNISPDKNLLTEWPKDGPELVWKYKGIGDGFAGITTADGRIFTAGNVDDHMVITVLDLDGKLLWTKKVGQAWTKNYPGSRGTPTIDGDRLYFEGPWGTVYCLDVEDGREIWSANILDEFASENIEWALAESVLVDQRRAIVLPAGKNTSLVALDKTDGKPVWRAKTADGDLAGYATATLAEFDGIPLVLTMTDESLIGVNAETGELYFRVPHKTEFNVNATKPVYHDGRVVVSSGYGTTGTVQWQLKREGDRVAAEQVWQSEELDNHHGGVLYYNGFLYGASHKFNRGNWICLDWKTGELKYKERGVGKGSLTLADGMLYLMSERGQVGLVRATPEAHEVINKFKLPRGGRGPTWAHPVVIGGRLYLRHGDFLFAYNVAK